ncbi:MAG TPA: T9SS type A sorting domain-containing protein [Flavobacteriales bacterium]|nr:T9SS type A sorting domain-containing protein [Flavobacteriales bacterium]
MKHQLAYVLSAGVVALVLTSGVTDNNGKAGRTGAPGENTCVNSCHNTYTLNSGAGSVTLGSTNMTNWEYVPGVTYHMTVTVSLASSVLFGVGVECLTSAGGNAGNLVVTNAASTQTKNATVSGNSRRNIVHQQGGGAGSGSKTFAFDWTAPTTNIGSVTFYYAGNATNNDDNEAGDRIYTGSHVITPAISTGIMDAVAQNAEVVVGPVPFDNTCSITYTSFGGGDVVLALYDMNGTMLDRVLTTERPAGRHTEVLDNMERFAAGTYLLVLDVNGQRITKTIVRTPGQ